MHPEDAYDAAVVSLTQDEVDAIWTWVRTVEGRAPGLTEHEIIEALDRWSEEGRRSRDTGTVCPYKAGTLAYYMHGCGWLRRDLQLALCRSNNGYREAQIACGQVTEDLL
jgi:hypothetical protein